MEIKTLSNYIFITLFSYLESTVHTDNQKGTYSWDYKSKSQSFLASGPATTLHSRFMFSGVRGIGVAQQTHAMNTVGRR